MHFLLTNDDGFAAPGIMALHMVARRLGGATIVAPHQEQSGCSHRVDHHRPLMVEQHADDTHAVVGTPAECTRLGVLHVAPETDVVLSGINDGGNLGVDVFMSGTVAAAREAALLGKPAIAISQYRRGPVATDWRRSAEMTAQVLATILDRPHEAGTFWNVNLPHLADGEVSTPEIIFCEPDMAHLDVAYCQEGNQFRYCGVYQKRGRTPGHDVDVCFGGQIAVSLIRLRP